MLNVSYFICQSESSLISISTYLSAYKLEDNTLSYRLCHAEEETFLFICDHCLRFCLIMDFCESLPWSWNLVTLIAKRKGQKHEMNTPKLKEQVIDSVRIKRKSEDHNFNFQQSYLINVICVFKVCFMQRHNMQNELNDTFSSLEQFGSSL